MTSDPSNDLSDLIIGDREMTAASVQKTYDRASGLSCPNCNGSVWALEDGTQTRIECRVGHAFSIDAFLGEQAIKLEEALWSAINSLQERADALRQFSAQATIYSAGGNYLERAEEMERQALVLREGLVRAIQADSDLVAVQGGGS